MSSFISFVLSVIYSCTGFRGEKYLKYTRKIKNLLFETSECPICLENLLSDQELVTMNCVVTICITKNVLKAGFHLENT